MEVNSITAPQNSTSNNEIILKLTFGDVNTIINALSERSFKDVYGLIGKIHSQSNAQLPPLKK